MLGMDSLVKGILVTTALPGLGDPMPYVVLALPTGSERLPVDGATTPFNLRLYISKGESARRVGDNAAVCCGTTRVRTTDSGDMAVLRTAAGGTGAAGCGGAAAKTAGPASSAGDNAGDAAGLDKPSGDRGASPRLGSRRMMHGALPFSPTATVRATSEHAREPLAVVDAGMVTMAVLHGIGDQALLVANKGPGGVGMGLVTSGGLLATLAVEGAPVGVATAGGNVTDVGTSRAAPAAIVATFTLEGIGIGAPRLAAVGAVAAAAAGNVELQPQSSRDSPRMPGNSRGGRAWPCSTLRHVEAAGAVKEGSIMFPQTLSVAALMSAAGSTASCGGSSRLWCDLADDPCETRCLRKISVMKCSKRRYRCSSSDANN